MILVLTSDKMKLCAINCLLFLLLNYAYGSSLKSNTTGRLIVSFGCLENDIERTILPINGGTISADSLKLVNKLQVSYRMGKKNIPVRAISYDWYIFPSKVRDFFSMGTQSTMDLKPIFFYNYLEPKYYYNYMKNASILIQVKYIVINENDTICNPVPYKTGEARYRSGNGGYSSSDTKKDTNKRQEGIIENWRKEFNHSKSEHSFYLKTENDVVFIERGIVFIVR